MRIAIVGHLESIRGLLRFAARSQPGWQLAWEARDAARAVSLCAQDTPDLILMDILLQEGGSVNATRYIMRDSPCAILAVMTGGKSSDSLAFEVLSAGALDVVDCPAGLSFASQGRLLSRIELIAARINRSDQRALRAKPDSLGPFRKGLPLVAIGSSAGGPAALRLLLAELPENFPAPLVITQHVEAKFAGDMASWLSSVSRLPVAVAQPGDRPAVGRALLAGSNDHLVLQEDGRLIYTDEPLDQPYRPSVDEFFASAALYWRGPVIAVLLTGMGQDGARGLLALRRLGHHTIAQDQQSAAVYGMPGTAARFGAAVAQMDPSAIGRELVRMIDLG